MRPAIAVFALVPLLAACGSTGGGSTGAAGSTQFALSQCMHSHGVPNFPDPSRGSGGGEGFSVSQSTAGGPVTIDGTTFSGPVFRAAVRTCRFFGGGAGPGGLTGTQEEAFIAKARCIRRHGVPGFPDPTFGPGGRGVGIKLGPGLSGDAPAILHAAKACAHVGAGIPGTDT
jgi:hypothetical protein